MMKKTFQLLSALALMVMSACAFVACNSDNDDNGDKPDNSKILGTWVITSISPSNGPSVGSEMTFNANGTFTAGRDQGTFTYNSSTGEFKGKMNSMDMKGTFTVNGNKCTGSVKVTEGSESQTYTMSMARKGSTDDPTDDDEVSEDVQDTRILGSWAITLDDDVPSSEGMTATFNKNGTFSIGSAVSGTYKTRTDSSNRIRFELWSNGQAINEGKLAVVSEGNVLTGIYGESGGDYDFRLNMKKPDYTYPTGGVKGRWLMKSASPKAAEENLPVGEVLVFGNNNELYQEGDSHAMTYGYSGNTLTINLEEGPISGTLTISGQNASYEFTMEGQKVTVNLEKK